MRISDLMSHPGSLVPERALWTSCPTCRQTQRLHEVPVTVSPTRVVYLCAQGCGPVLTLTFGALDSRPAIHRRDWVVENPSVLFCRPITGDRESIRFPPSI
jgi:hypothetical protein